VAIPADFPKDVTVPAKIKVNMAMATPDGHLIAFNVDRKASDVADEVSAAMIGAQWKQHAQMDMGQQKLLVYEKDNRTATYTIAQTDNAETCGGQIAVSTKKQ
jgi:hypothetical protein